jgi:hypothetical protein
MAQMADRAIAGAVVLGAVAYGAKKLGRRCGCRNLCPCHATVPILVEEAADAVASLDLVDLGWCAMRERA